MKNPLLTSFSLCFALALPAFGQITADVAISEAGTPLGTITLELDHLNAPMATANFIGLATGEHSWINSTTGAVQSNTPYYSGIKIHRTVKGFVSQFGSQKGDGSDGPGYTFPDQPDLSNPLSHDGPYILSMANSGPNTNGSQVFFTAAARTDLDPKHVIFGKIALGESRTLADYINCVPVVDADGPDNILGTSDDNNTPVTDLIITSVTVDLNGVAFDFSAQGLPEVYAPVLTAPFGPATTDLAFLQSPRSLSRLSISDNLSDWQPIVTRYLDESNAPENDLTLGGQTVGKPKQFVASSIVQYPPSAIFPEELTNRTLSVLIPADPVNPINFTFDSAGNGSTGTWAYQSDSGTITVNSFTPDGYGCFLVITANGFNPGYFVFRRIGFDSSTPTFLSGRTTGGYAQNSFFYNIGLRTNFEGTFTLTR